MLISLTLATLRVLFDFIRHYNERMELLMSPRAIPAITEMDEIVMSERLVHLLLATETVLLHVHNTLVDS